MNADYYIKRRETGAMNRTSLIQRLKEPFANEAGYDLASVFAFGGGLTNGGLTKEAAATLRRVFRFDYMGSSEFEWGSVPAAIARIARETGSFVSGRLEIDPETVRVPHKGKKPTDNMTVYFLAHRDEAEQVKGIIRELARDEFTLRLKESCGLDRALCGDEWAASGWLELNNGFMFFVDRQMFTKAAHLFGIKV